MIIKTKFKDLYLFKNKISRTKGVILRKLLENKLKKKFPFLVMSYSKQNVVEYSIQTKNSQGNLRPLLKENFDVAIDLRKIQKPWKSI